MDYRDYRGKRASSSEAALRRRNYPWITTRGFHRNYFDYLVHATLTHYASVATIRPCCLDDTMVIPFVSQPITPADFANFCENCDYSALLPRQTNDATVIRLFAGAKWLRCSAKFPKTCDYTVLLLGQTNDTTVIRLFANAKRTKLRCLVKFTKTCDYSILLLGQTNDTMVIR